MMTWKTYKHMLKSYQSMTLKHLLKVKNVLKYFLELEPNRGVKGYYV